MLNLFQELLELIRGKIVLDCGVLLKCCRRPLFFPQERPERFVASPAAPLRHGIFRVCKASGADGPSDKVYQRLSTYDFTLAFIKGMIQSIIRVADVYDSMLPIMR